MPPRRDGICGILTRDFPSTRIQGGKVLGRRGGVASSSSPSVPPRYLSALAMLASPSSESTEESICSGAIDESIDTAPWCERPAYRAKSRTPSAPRSSTRWPDAADPCTWRARRCSAPPLTATNTETAAPPVCREHLRQEGAAHSEWGANGEGVLPGAAKGWWWRVQKEWERESLTWGTPRIATAATEATAAVAKRIAKTCARGRRESKPPARPRCPSIKVFRGSLALQLRRTGQQANY